jgi:Domain of unknown function (DUF4136)
MKQLKTIMLSGAALVLASCASAPTVKIDYDKAANFAPITTFSIKLGTSWGNQIGEKRVMDELTQALTGKGWKLVPEGQGDALVVVHGASKTKKDLNTFYSGMGGGYGYRGWGGMGGMGTATTTVTEYQVGTLVVDVFDAKSKSLLWRGIAQDEVSDNPEKNIQKVAKASDKMFADFPPGSAKK